MIPRIFIGYVPEDKAFVKNLEAELKAVGADVWSDHCEIHDGEELSQQVRDILSTCTSVLLIWSCGAQKSYQVELELKYAMSQEKDIIPCLLDETKLPDIFTSWTPLHFRNFDYGIENLFKVLKFSSRSKVVELPKQGLDDSGTESKSAISSKLQSTNEIERRENIKTLPNKSSTAEWWANIPDWIWSILALSLPFFVTILLFLWRKIVSWFPSFPPWVPWSGETVFFIILLLILFRIVCGR